MSAAPISDGTPNAAIARVMSKSKDISVLPHVVFQIMEMTASDESSAGSLERAVVVDPGFSAKLLSQANSASLGLPKKVSSIREAIMFLGFRQVRSLAMTVGVFDMFVGKTDKESLRRRKWWRHSLDTAATARFLAGKLGACEAETAYTCGLLHLLGKTILCRYDSSKFEQVESLVSSGRIERDAERSVYGCDHVEILSAAGSAWGFPQSLQEGLDYDDEPAEDDPAKNLRAVVCLASLISGMAIDGKVDANQLSGHWSAACLGLGTEKLIGLGHETLTMLSETARAGG